MTSSPSLTVYAVFAVGRPDADSGEGLANRIGFDRGTAPASALLADVAAYGHLNYNRIGR